MPATERPEAHATLPRPTLRGAAPFVGVGSMGLASVFFPPYDSAWNIESSFMVVSFLVVLVLLVVGIRRTSRTWIDAAPVMVFFFALAAARDLSGGTESGLGSLVALPLLWLALTGTLRELLLASGLTVAMFVTPIYLFGPPDYDVGDWRKAVAWGAFGMFVAPTIQRLVRQLATETMKERIARAELDGVMRGATLSSMITTDSDGLIRSFGVGAEQLLGYRPEQMEGLLTPSAFHDPAEVAAVATELGVEPGFAVFAELARRRDPSRIWTYVRADGHRIFVRLAVTELRDRDAALNGYLGVAIDTTASVRSERALSMSEARWRALMDNLADTTVVMLDEELRIRVVSGRGAMRQGMHDAVGKKLEEVSNEANMAVWRPLLAEAFEGREGTVDIASAVTGAEHEVVVTPLPPEEDGPRVLLLARDVSRERARERAVVAAKERAERLFADAPHGVALLDSTGSIVQANDALLAMVGAPPGGLAGVDLSSLGVAGTDELRERLTVGIDEDATVVEVEWTLTNRLGPDVHVLLSGRRLPEIDGSGDLILVNVVDVSERHLHQQELVHLADHDPLTGLANRRRFEAVLQKHLESCERHGATGALLLVDLDHFKEVNDTLGHGVGDELIVSTADTLTRCLRSSDVVARIGGDEFAILLPQADEVAAEVVAASVVDQLRSLTANLEGPLRRVTASVGVVTVEAASHQSMDLLALADMSMYDAKDAGRNRYATLGTGADNRPRTAVRMEWKDRLEKALENDTFSLRFQPIRNLHSGRVESAEALIRLDDRDETAYPSEFLGIGERAGLAPDIDRWVLRRSISDLAKLRELDPDFQLEVNMSGHSIGQPEIERTVVAALNEFGVDPGGLILEITETAAVADVLAAREFADRMTALGCKFALDDFGAGFGSFYYLKHLTFDFVKIDGEFVANCHRNAIDRTIVRSIAGIARDLGKRTIAEFVAEPEILEVVREEGIDFAQGNLIGKPMLLDDFVARFLYGNQSVPRA